MAARQTAPAVRRRLTRQAEGGDRRAAVWRSVSRLIGLRGWRTMNVSNRLADRQSAAVVRFLGA